MPTKATKKKTSCKSKYSRKLDIRNLHIFNSSYVHIHKDKEKNWLIKLKNSDSNSEELKTIQLLNIEIE